MKKGMYKFLVSISCFCLCMSFFVVPVKAEMDIMYPDEYQYSGYNYFFNHGYNHLILTSSDNVTYNVDLDNRGSNNGTITGTDGLSGSSHETGTVGTNGSASLGSKYMTCTTNNAVSGTQTYSCYFSSSSYGVNNSQSINIQMNENTYEDYSNVDVNVNETIKQTIDTDITGSITSSTSSRSYIYLPWLQGTYTHITSYVSTDRIAIPGNDDFYLMFFTSVGLATSQRVINIYQNSSSNNITYKWDVKNFPSGLRLHVITFSSGSATSTDWFSFDLTGLTSQEIIPFFFGAGLTMPDNVAEMAGLRRSVGYILNNGNESTSHSVSDAEQTNNEVSNKIGQFDTLENNSITDMNSKISNLNLTSDILSNSKFLSSARWVKTQFDRMTVSNPIGSVLSFSLILGMTLIFLGKIR